MPGEWQDHLVVKGSGGRILVTRSYFTNGQGGELAGASYVLAFDFMSFSCFVWHSFHVGLSRKLQAENSVSMKVNHWILFMSKTLLLILSIITNNTGSNKKPSNLDSDE